MNDMGTIRQNNFKRLAASYSSQKALADALCTTPGWVNQLCIGRREIGEKAARKIELALKLPQYFLDKTTEETNAKATEMPQQPLHPVKTNLVPLISWVQAGGFAECVDNYHPNDGGEAMIETTVPVRQHTYALRVVGDSMEPEFMAGDVIVVEPELQPENGYYVIAKNGDKATFKQLIMDGGDWYLRPLNDRYPLKPLGDGHVIGVVREKSKRYC